MGEHLMEHICACANDVVMVFLESGQNRGLLHAYLEGKSKGVQWYGQPASVYFEREKLQLIELLGKARKPEVLIQWLRERVRKMESDMLQGGVSGRMVPEMFGSFFAPSDMQELE